MKEKKKDIERRKGEFKLKKQKRIRNNEKIRGKKTTEKEQIREN